MLLLSGSILYDGHGCRRDAVLLFERCREMGLIFEADFGIDVCNFLTVMLYHGIGGFQSLADKPFFGSQVAYFLEIAFERGKASACVVCKLFHCEFVHVVFIHEVQDINFPWLVEIEKGGRKPRVYVEEGKQAFLQFEVHEVVSRFYVRVEKWGQRGEKACYFCRFGQLDYARFQFGRVSGNFVLCQRCVHLP